MTIQTRNVKKRGCGWRTPGGLYLVTDGRPQACGLFPIELKICPTCSGGIKPTRGWTWVKPHPLIVAKVGPDLAEDSRCRPRKCDRCPLEWGDRCGLIWIGGVYYDEPEKLLAEAARMGISRRIPAVPKGFELGKTWVLMAHRHAIQAPCAECKGKGHTKLKPKTRQRAISVACDACEGSGVGEKTAAIFGAFKPAAIEYVVKGTETEKQIERLEKRGITPVRDVREGELDFSTTRVRL